MRVAITFDNGPEPGVTEGVLDILSRYEIKATFFVIGRKLERPEGRRLVARAAAEGHRIGNHTYTHTVALGRMDGRAAVDEICRTQDLIERVSTERLFRPYGEGGGLGPHLLSPAARDHLASHRFTCVLWNVVPGDWKDPEGWVDDAVAACSIRNSPVLVLHDLPTGALRRLPTFLDRLKALGAEMTQAFPDECVPIRAGVVAADCGRYVAR
ncbi:MAG: polysaccharide deacetylase family protein [Methylobacteriaceae bacterium]|nr:polysaccharide deacetylase family protein [Methylobacteriaceae bacterium]